jgi:hypothetical protein
MEDNHSGVRCGDVMIRLGRIERLYVVKQSSDSVHPGVRTTEREKEAAVILFNDLLYTNRVRFSKSLFTHSQPRLGDETPPGFIISQLMAYEKKTVPSRDGIVKFRFSGKGTGVDDAATSLLLACLWAILVLTNPEYLGGAVPGYRPIVHPSANTVTSLFSRYSSDLANGGLRPYFTDPSADYISNRRAVPRTAVSALGSD